MVPAPVATTRAWTDQPLVVEIEVGESGPAGDGELGFDQVDARHLLGDRVLDLDAGVALDEEVLAGLRRNQELDGSGVDVAGGPDQLDGVRVEPGGNGQVEVGGGRDLDDLLVALLHRTVPFVQVDGVSVPVREYLDLDVARPCDVALDEHGAVAEGGLGFTAAPLKRLVHLLGRLDHPHTAAAAAASCLQHDGVAHIAGRFTGTRGRADSPVASRHDRDAERLGELTGPDLVAEQGDGLGRGADEGDPGRGARFCQRCVLGQEAVPGVDGVASGVDGGPHDGIDVEVGRYGVTGRQLDRLIGDPGVERLGVDRRVHADRLEPEALGGSGNTDGDLTPVGDEDTGQAHGNPLDAARPSWPRRRSGAEVRKIRRSRRLESAQCEIPSRSASECGRWMVHHGTGGAHASWAVRPGHPRADRGRDTRRRSRRARGFGGSGAGLGLHRGGGGGRPARSR
jgi:hypothetical protein